MWRPPVLTFAAAFVGTGGVRRAPESPVPQDLPHISWEVASDNDDHSAEKHACTSVQRSPCELPMGTPDKPVTGEFTLYLHPAAEEATYMGVVDVGFLGLDPARPSKINVNQRVPARSKSSLPPQASISNRISAKPGDYRVSMKIVATTNRKGTRIEDAVTVTIRPPGQRN